MTEAWQQQGKLLETILRHFQTKQIFRRNNYYVSAKKAGQSVDSRSVPRGKTHATSGEIMDAENNFQTGTGWYFFLVFRGGGGNYYSTTNLHIFSLLFVVINCCVHICIFSLTAFLLWLCDSKTAFFAISLLAPLFCAVRLPCLLMIGIWLSFIFDIMNDVKKYPY